MNESWINELAGEPTMLEPRPDFESALRERLSDEWNGRPTIAPAARGRADDNRPKRGWLLAAAAATIVLVGGAGFIALRDDSSTIVTPGTDVPDPTPAPTAPDVAPVTEPVVEPDPSANTEPLNTEPPTSSPGSTAPPLVTPAGPANLLEGWPAVTEPGSLESVPRLVPSEGVPGATDVVRIEYAGTPPTSSTRQYGQMWVAADGSGLIEIQTTVGVDFPPDAGGSDSTVFEAAPWDLAYFTPSTSGSVNVTLTDPGGYVFVSTQGLDDQVAADVARSLTRRDGDRPGWDVGAIPAGFIEFGENGATAGAGRTIQWRAADGMGRAELQISAGNPSAVRVAFPLPGESQTPPAATPIGDVTGYAFQSNPDRAVVAWSPEPGVTVLLGYGGPVDEAVAIARSMQAVDQATWDAASSVATSTDDGCDSLYFC